MGQLHTEGLARILRQCQPQQQGDDMTAERRSTITQLSRTLRRELNEAQIDTLTGLERFGWDLKFIRRPLFKESIPVIFDGDRKVFAILEPDGRLNERPPFTLRPV